ncbi:MAG: HNH endonuclease [Bacteroidota bacterium]
MPGILMHANIDWIHYHQKHSIGKRVVFYVSLKRKSYGHNYLFCILGKPRSIYAYGTIVNQEEIHQKDAWAKYSTALGANTEIEWVEQASKVLEYSERKYDSNILAIVLDNFQIFPRPVTLSEVGIPSTNFRSMKNVSDVFTTNILSHLPEEESPSEKNEPPPVEPERETIIEERIIRDTKISIEIKKLYQYRCQLCNYRIEYGNGQYYAESHHIKPLGSPHNGPDSRDNILCVCPNCHAKLDLGAIELDTKKINNYINEHPINNEYIEYHNTRRYKK